MGWCWPSMATVSVHDVEGDRRRVEVRPGAGEMLPKGFRRQWRQACRGRAAEVVNRPAVMAATVARGLDAAYLVSIAESVDLAERLAPAVRELGAALDRP